MLVDQTSDDEETYYTVRDGFELRDPRQRTEEENRYQAKLTYPDLGEKVNILERQEEEQKILTREDKLKSFCTDAAIGGTYKMIATTESFACAFFIETPALDTLTCVEELAERERNMFTERLKKMTTQIQCTLFIKECNSKIKIGFANIAYLEEIIKKASEKRETLPKGTLQDIAEHPDAIAEARRLMHEIPENDSKKRPICNVHVFKDSDTMPRGKKHSKKRIPFQKTNQDDAKRRLLVLNLNRGSRIWDPKAKHVKCRGNAVSCIWERMICAVDQLYDDEKEYWKTRVRLYKYNDLKTAKLERYIEDRHHVLGRIKSVDMTNANVILLTYPRHVICIKQGQRPFALAFDTYMCTCSTYMQDSGHIAIGSSHGAIYFFNDKTGEAEGYIDMPLSVPIVGLKGGTSLLAWDHRSVYRFHPESSVVAPYVFDSGRPMGVSVCGSLICTLNDIGDVWISNMFQSGLSRQFYPPATIASKEEIDEETVCFKLHMPITYDYQAIHMTRTKITILYPCGLVRQFVVI